MPTQTTIPVHHTTTITGPSRIGSFRSSDTNWRVHDETLQRLRHTGRDSTPRNYHDALHEVRATQPPGSERDSIHVDLPADGGGWYAEYNDNFWPGRAMLDMGCQCDFCLGLRAAPCEGIDYETCRSMRVPGDPRRYPEAMAGAIMDYAGFPPPAGRHGGGAGEGRYLPVESTHSYDADEAAWTVRDDEYFDDASSIDGGEQIHRARDDTPHTANSDNGIDHFGTDARNVGPTTMFDAAGNEDHVNVRIPPWHPNELALEPGDWHQDPYGQWVDIDRPYNMARRVKILEDIVQGLLTGQIPRPIGP